MQILPIFSQKIAIWLNIGNLFQKSANLETFSPTMEKIIFLAEYSPTMSRLLINQVGE